MLSGNGLLSPNYTSSVCHFRGARRTLTHWISSKLRLNNSDEEMIVKMWLKRATQVTCCNPSSMSPDIQILWCFLCFTRVEAKNRAEV